MLKSPSAIRLWLQCLSSFGPAGEPGGDLLQLGGRSPVPSPKRTCSVTSVSWMRSSCEADRVRRARELPVEAARRDARPGLDRRRQARRRARTGATRRMSNTKAIRSLFPALPRVTSVMIMAQSGPSAPSRCRSAVRLPRTSWMATTSKRETISAMQRTSKRSRFGSSLLLGAPLVGEPAERAEVPRGRRAGSGRAASPGSRRRAPCGARETARRAEPEGDR